MLSKSSAIGSFAADRKFINHPIDSTAVSLIPSSIAIDFDRNTVMAVHYCRNIVATRCFPLSIIVVADYWLELCCGGRPHPS